MSEGPRPCTIFCFALTRPTRFYLLALLVTRKSTQNKPIFFLHGQGQKRKQKHGTKNFVGLHNHFLLSTFVYSFSDMKCFAPRLVLKQRLQELGNGLEPEHIYSTD